MATLVRTCARITLKNSLAQRNEPLVCILRKLGTQTQAQEYETPLFSNPLFRSDGNDPLKLNRTNIGQYYKVDEASSQRLFKLGGYPKEFLNQATTFGEACIMVREPALEIIECLNNANYEHPAVKYVLYGRNGCGKSCSLAHVIHYCDTLDWVIVHVPWVPSWTRRVKEITPSLSFKDKLDLPVPAAVWLQHFKLQNAEKIERLDIRTSKTYTWGKREETVAGQPLLDIVDMGLNRMKYSTDCVYAMLDEIKLNAESGKFKMLAAIDGVNGFYDMTTLRKEFRVLIKPDELTLITAFKDFIASKWKNGALVATVDRIAGNDRRESHYPQYLLSKEGFGVLEPFVPVHVPEYSKKEISSCLDYYIDRNWIQNEKGRTNEGKSELVFLSGYNPYSLMRICAAW